MICPKCKTHNSFKQDGKSVYCVAVVGGKKCFYKLGKDEHKTFKKELISKNLQSKKRGYSIKEIAELNDVHRNTVLKHKDEFDIIPDTKPVRYKFNKKILKENWKTPHEKMLDQYIEVKATHFYGCEISEVKTNKLT